MLIGFLSFFRYIDISSCRWCMFPTIRVRVSNSGEGCAFSGVVGCVHSAEVRVIVAQKVCARCKLQYSRRPPHTLVTCLRLPGPLCLFH